MCVVESVDVVTTQTLTKHFRIDDDVTHVKHETLQTSILGIVVAYLSPSVILGQLLKSNPVLVRECYQIKNHI